MQTITTIGLDIAKSVFQIHGVGADGQVVIRRQLKRRYVLVGRNAPKGNIGSWTRADTFGLGRSRRSRDMRSRRAPGDFNFGDMSEENSLCERGRCWIVRRTCPCV
jgi:hypothetical protein